jgi:hypothetical protein
MIDEGRWDILSWPRCSGFGGPEPGRRPACKKGIPFPFVLKGTYALRRFGLGNVGISM